METIEFFPLSPNPDKGKRPVNSSVSSSPSKKFRTMDMELINFFSTGSSSTASSSNGGNAADFSTGPVNISTRLFNIFTGSVNIPNRSVNIPNGLVNGPTGPDNVSTDLSLSNNSRISVKIENPSVPCASRKLPNFEAINISKVRTYTKKQKEQELRFGISTELGLSAYPWSIKKKLTESDLGHLSRLIINKEPVDNHVLKFLPKPFRDQIESKEGALVQVWDHDTDSSYQLKFKRWNSSKSYVLNGVWSKEFVKRRELRKDDVIGLYWDLYEFRFCFCVLQRAAVSSS